MNLVVDDRIVAAANEKRIKETARSKQRRAAKKLEHEALMAELAALRKFKEDNNFTLLQTQQDKFEMKKERDYANRKVAEMASKVKEVAALKVR